MNRPSQQSHKHLFSIVLVFALICGVSLVVAWTADSSPAHAFMDGLSPTPTQGPRFGYVEIAKPTYTALPVSTATLSPISRPATTATPTSTPTSLIHAEIVTAASSPAVQSQPTYAPDPANGGSKRILVDISEQHMYVYEGDTLIWSFVASTGMNNATRVGTFSVLEKIPNAYGATWNIWMPDWLGIYWAGNLQNGIHALPILPGGQRLWAGYLGTPISYGCVVLGVQEAQMLYDWAEVGTPVEIQR